MNSIHPLWEESIFCSQKLIHFLIKKGLSLTIISQISKNTIGDLRAILRAQRPMTNLGNIINSLLFFKEVVDKYERDQIEQPIFDYLINKFRFFNDSQYMIDDSPNDFEPSFYSEKHGGDVCRI